MTAELDVDAVRRAFPALAEGAAHFDGPGGSQVPAAVARAVADTLTSGIANRGTVTAAECRADAIVVEARRAVADLVGGEPHGVVFGRSMTQLTFDFSRALAKRWSPGDEIVVSSLDHDANIRPWVLAAQRVGVTVRWAEFDPETAELPTAAVADLLSPRTRLVAVTAASNLLGTCPDVPSIAAAAHGVGALVYVDGVHRTPHTPVDVAALGADFFVCSPYKFFGPHLGALVADPSLLEELTPDKLLPATDAVPERFELGTLPYELLAGTTAAIDFIAGLVPGGGERRGRALASMAALECYEAGLFARLFRELRTIDGLQVYGEPAHRTPTVLFSLNEHPPREIYEHLGTRGVNAPAGNFYAIEPSRRLGLGEGGAVRAGLAPYTAPEDIDRLVDAVRALAAGRRS